MNRHRLLAGAAVLALFCAGPPAEAAITKASPSGEEAWRLNCGSVDYTATDGNLWMGDEEFSVLSRWGYANGAGASTTTAVSGTAEDPLYQSHRWGPAGMAYRVSLPNGTYQVKLMFCETFWDAPAERVFDVALEGNTVLSGHDVFAEVGGFVADDHLFTVTVADQVLDVTFPAVGVDNAMISGIEVKPVSVTDDAFLDFLQRRMFEFFWNEVDSTTKFIRDKAKNFTISAPNICTIGGVGFGFSIYTIGVERGWITAAQAYDRIMKILDGFNTWGAPRLDAYHGFWYHGVNPATLARDGTFELSTVDSALFILGALQAGEYFRAAYPDLTARVDALYRDMEWDWWINRTDSTPAPPNPDNDPFVNMAWLPPGECNGTYNIPAPGGGCFAQLWWNEYSETVLVNLLAFGSPTYPIGAEAWANMKRTLKNDMGYRMVDQAPLFAHQFHHLYYDLRDKHDGFLNYDDNTRIATMYQRDYARARPALYEENAWGFTNGLTPVDNYRTYGPGLDDGTIMPSAAVTSIPHLPEDGIRAARYMFFQYKHHIWGRYGFTDSYNVSQNYVAPDAISLENGSMVIAIENYRTGLVRDTFMRSPYVQTALQKAGFQSYDAAPLLLASTEENNPSPQFAARRAYDGDMSTRWASAFTNSEWLAIDFGSPRAVTGFTIRWEDAYAKNYSIQSSNDGLSWSNVMEITGGNGGTDNVAFSTATARFFRILGTQRALDCCGYSIWEMDVNFPTEPPIENDVELAPDAPRVRAGQETVIAFADDPATRLLFPSGAASEDIFLRLRLRSGLSSGLREAADAADAKGAVDVVRTTLREFTAVKEGGGAFGNFDKRVMVEIPYADADGDGVEDVAGLPVDRLRIFRLNEAARVWEMAADGGANGADPQTKVVRAELGHFSVYTVGAASGQDLNALTVYPNPVDFSRAVRNAVKFDNLSRDATVRIYDLSGRLVRDLPPGSPGNDGNSGRAEWDGRDVDGALVSSGLYFYLATDPSGGKAKGRLAVVRR